MHHLGDYRPLHRRLRIREPYGYWIQQLLTQFRWVHGLQHRPGSPAESRAFQPWLQAQLAPGPARKPGCTHGPAMVCAGSANGRRLQAVHDPVTANAGIEAPIAAHTPFRGLWSPLRWLWRCAGLFPPS